MRIFYLMLTSSYLILVTKDQSNMIMIQKLTSLDDFQCHNRSLKVKLVNKLLKTKFPIIWMGNSQKSFPNWTFKIPKIGKITHFLIHALHTEKSLEYPTIIEDKVLQSLFIKVTILSISWFSGIIQIRHSHLCFPRFHSTFQCY